MRRSGSRSRFRRPSEASRSARSARWTDVITPPGAVASAAASAAVADAHRREWARVLAATLRVTRDVDLAEECVQDAYVSALSAWRSGMPASPAAWLTTSARHRALDHVRRAAVLRRKLSLLVVPEGDERTSAG